MTTLKNVWSAVKSVAVKVWATVKRTAVKAWTTVKKNADVVLMSFGF